MNFEELDWEVLDRLRAGFLRGDLTHGPYWKSAIDLSHYDQTYGERIGWKWDHVLRELDLRGWRPRARKIFDWGCGSGIAARRVIRWLGADNIAGVTLHDHAPVAASFAADRVRAEFPGLSVTASASSAATDATDTLLIISHVLNELPAPALAELRSMISQAAEVIWVENGQHAVSRELGRLRDELRADFTVIAPCTHPLGCPMFAPENERHWCHFFAPPPSEIFADSGWVRFGHRAGIDLRSLPYSFIALSRDPCIQVLDTTLSRIIGRPEFFKPQARWLNCDETGLHTLELPKRSDPALYKKLERTTAPLVYRWTRTGQKVATGVPAGEPERGAGTGEPSEGGPAGSAPAEGERAGLDSPGPA